MSKEPKTHDKDSDKFTEKRRETINYLRAKMSKEPKTPDKASSKFTNLITDLKIIGFFLVFTVVIAIIMCIIVDAILPLGLTFILFQNLILIIIILFVIAFMALLATPYQEETKATKDKDSSD